MSNIQENLQKILTAVWGRDVRQAIHDAIHDCYEDASSGTTDLPARERIDALETNSATKTELQAEVTARTNADADINTTIGTVAMGTSATTLKGAIKELLGKINTNTTNISSNLSKINTNISNISSNLSKINANTTKINTNTTNISTLTTKIGSVAMGTTATTVTGAVKELLTKINTLTSNLNTTNTNLNTQKGRVDTLVSKTSGLVSFATSNVDANSNGYRQLTATGMYLVLINGATVSNTVRGIYLVGVTSGNALGIKAISEASIAKVTDGGSGLLKIQNTGSVVLRLTLIRVY